MQRPFRPCRARSGRGNPVKRLCIFETLRLAKNFWNQIKMFKAQEGCCARGAENLSTRNTTLNKKNLGLHLICEKNCSCANLALQIFKSRKMKAKNNKSFTRHVTGAGWDKSWQDHVRGYKMDGRGTPWERQPIFNGERCHDYRSGFA